MLTHSCERAKIVDLFPRTDNTYKNHTRPIPAKAENEKYIPDIKMMLSFHVECMAGSTMYSLPTRTFYQTAQETIIENAWIS
jgi:hypothetical protein